MQAANIKFELADELCGKFAYVEAMKLYEEARDIFVQVYLTVAVLNTVMAAVAPFNGCCRAALPSVTHRRATGVVCPNRQCHLGFAPVNLVKWISSCKNVTETQVRFPEKPHSLLQRVAARNVVS